MPSTVVPSSAFHLIGLALREIAFGEELIEGGEGDGRSAAGSGLRQGKLQRAE